MQTKLTASILCVLLVVLTIPLAGCSKVSALVAAIDLFSAAVAEAEAFVPAGSPALSWLALSATFADWAATEVASGDTASVQLSKLLTEANILLNQAVPTGITKIDAAVAALRALIALINSLRSGVGVSANEASYARAIAQSKPLPLNSKDKQTLSTIHSRMARYLKK